MLVRKGMPSNNLDELMTIAANAIEKNPRITNVATILVSCSNERLVRGCLLATIHKTFSQSKVSHLLKSLDGVILYP